MWDIITATAHHKPAESSDTAIRTQVRPEGVRVFPGLAWGFLFALPGWAIVGIAVAVGMHLWGGWR